MRASIQQIRQIHVAPVVNRLLITPASQQLLAIQFAGPVKFWQPESLQVNFELDVDGIVSPSASMSPDENYLAVMSHQNGSRIFRKAEGVFKKDEYKRFANEGYCAFSADSSSTIWSNIAAFFCRHMETGNYSALAEDAPDRCNGVALHPDGDLLAFSSCWAATSEITLLKLSDKNYRHQVCLRYDELTPPTFSPDGRWLSVSHWLPELYLLSDVFASDGRCTPTFRFDLEGQIKPVFQECSTVDYAQLWTKQTFDTKRQLFIAGSPQGKIFAWNLSDGSIHSQVQAHEGKVFDIAFSESHDLLFSCGADGFLKSWRLI